MNTETANTLMSFALPAVLILFFIFGIFMPQRKQQKKVKEMLNSLKPGDRVKTIGGLYGTVSQVKTDVVTLEVGPDKVKMIFARNAIGSVEGIEAENTTDISADKK
ncbi:MAG: preprotein translocase subunit YajC [Christensenellales bacterium]